MATNGGLSAEQLRRKVEQQCIAAGYPPVLDIEETEDAHQPNETEKSEIKWHICHNFVKLNKHTEIAPMPQGDICDKQQCLSGHQWISTFDFASGFYGVTLDKASQPYVCFYVEGKGYFAYKRMPFGLTGAPSEFTQLTATHLHDLVMQLVLEIFVDDGGTAADTFEEGMEKLNTIFKRAREQSLSISASKLKLFVSQAVLQEC
jgi:hypothetical protein